MVVISPLNLTRSAMVDRISAADNFSIEIEPERWRLIANGNGTAGESVVVEASPGRPLRYIAGFGRTRRLPDSGALPVEHIQRVVLGWSHQDEAWHLGFVLATELAQARGSRWCEIVRWPDPETDVYEELALRAGKNLAQAVSRPFYLVPPQTEAAPAAAPALPLTPARTLPEPPFTFDLWTFERTDGDRFQLVRSRAWALTGVRRILWYGLWTAVYVLLVVTTLTAGIAPSRPEWLPYLGIVSAGILVLLILRNMVNLLTQPNRIVIESGRRSVRGLVGEQEWWRVAADQIESVYVSQVVGKGRQGRASQYGELNLYRLDGKFQRILSVEQTVDLPADAADTFDNEAVVELTADNAFTPLQAAAVYIAQALGVTCYYDNRL